MDRTLSSQKHHQNTPSSVLQTIPNKYLDEYKLKALLERLFGSGCFKIQNKAGEWTIKAQRALTDAEIESTEQPGQY
ncbi:hypothetical protein B0O99DRAFT_737457 [Bisporella sp. PMI_857]|nr:hypothetical protein B0O99DRAFT_737457 [Bisporella sp. PMI_857]